MKSNPSTKNKDGENGEAEQRKAYSPSQAAKACGKSLSWAYRAIWSGKLKVTTELGSMLIPATELDRVLGDAKPYNPKPKEEKAVAV